MIKESFAALGASTRDLFRNWRGLLLLAAVYGLLLASVYYFFATGVANAWQLVVTALTAAAAPLLFFLFQAAAANAALPEATAGRVVRRAPRDLLKVLLLAVPVALFAALFVYLLYKLEGWLPKVDEPTHYAGVMSGERPVPLHWQEALLSSSWLLLLGVLLPLAAAHLWLSAARVGLKATLKGLHRVVGRAFAPRSVLVYVVGLFLFGMMPYFVLYTRTSFTNGWSELLLFGLRLALTFLLTLVGWVVTLGALARLACATSRAQGPEPTPARDERLERILEKVGEGVEKYQAELFRIAFAETLRQEELREEMTPKKSKEFVFDTIVAREALSDEEDDYYPKIVRRIRTIDGKPAKRAGKRDEAAGTYVSSLVFLLPKHRKEYQFSLEGEEKLEGRRAYRIRILRPGEGPPRVEWKKHLVGFSFYVFAPTLNFLWVDAETFDVLRYESHLAEPFEFDGPRAFGAGPLRLGPSRRFKYKVHDYAVNFRRERFKDPEQTLLVPVAAEWTRVIEGASKPRTRATLRFSDYRRFRSDVKIIEDTDN